jgi:aminodeoxyfutalosine synthase
VTGTVSGAVNSQIAFAPERHSFQTDDRRLRPIADKVLAGERLDFNDGVALYRSGDVLAVG